MNLTERFLKAKHWQLFLLFFGLPMTIYAVMMWNIISVIIHNAKPDPSIIIDQFKFFPIIMVVFMAGLFSWLWSIVTGFQQKIPAHIKMNMRMFKVFFFVPFIYLTSISIAVSILLQNLPEIIENNSQPNVGLLGGLMIVIIPLHFFSIFCIFYTLYFVAKTYKTAELQRETTFSDFVGEFFLLWFYPIGVWIIQPKINSLAEGTD